MVGLVDEKKKDLKVRLRSKKQLSSGSPLSHCPIRRPQHVGGGHLHARPIAVKRPWSRVTDYGAVHRSVSMLQISESPRYRGQPTDPKLTRIQPTDRP